MHHVTESSNPPYGAVIIKLPFPNDETDLESS